MLRQARQSLDRLSGSWEPWLLLPSQLVYLARPVSAGKLAPQALICMIQVVPAVPVFVYPVCNPLTTALSLFQIPDLFAQSDLSWSLLLGDLSRSAGVWGVAPAVPSLHEAFQSWCRLFSTAYWKSQERFYSSFVVPCENNTSHALSAWHGLSLPLACRTLSFGRLL